MVTYMASMTNSEGVCPYCGAELEPLINIFASKPFKVGYKPCACERAVGERERLKYEEQLQLEREREKDRLQREADNRKRRIAESGIPRRFSGIKDDMDIYVNEIANGKSFMFSGDVGTGKTYLACAIGLAMIDKSSVVFTNISEVNRLLFDRNSLGEVALFNRLSLCDLLIIDDIGKEKPSEWITSLIYQVINARYEAELPMILTSNYSYEELRRRLANGGDDTTAIAIVSRLFEMCGRPLRINGQDKRLHGVNRGS